MLPECFNPNTRVTLSITVQCPQQSIGGKYGLRRISNFERVAGLCRGTMRLWRVQSTEYPSVTHQTQIHYHLTITLSVRQLISHSKLHSYNFGNSLRQPSLAMASTLLYSLYSSPMLLWKAYVHCRIGWAILAAAAKYNKNICYTFQTIHWSTFTLFQILFRSTFHRAMLLFLLF